MLTPSRRNIPVVLTAREVEIAHFVAGQRDEAGKGARADAGKFGNGMDTLQLHWDGCLGELAAAKGLDRYWFGGGTSYQEDEDLGTAQVRMTRYRTGRLLIRPVETLRPTIDTPWILVVQHTRAQYTLVGWIIGREGIRAEYLWNPGGRPEAYFVPRLALQPFPLPEPRREVLDAVV